MSKPEEFLPGVNKISLMDVLAYFTPKEISGLEKSEGRLYDETAIRWQLACDFETGDKVPKEEHAKYFIMQCLPHLRKYHQHDVILSNGCIVRLEEGHEGLHVCEIWKGEVEAYICIITPEGVLVMPNSGSSCDTLAKNHKPVSQVDKMSQDKTRIRAKARETLMASSNKMLIGVRSARTVRLISRDISRGSVESVGLL